MGFVLKMRWELSCVLLLGSDALCSLVFARCIHNSSLIFQRRRCFREQGAGEHVQGVDTLLLLNIFNI